MILIYDLIGAHVAGEQRDAFDHMRALGVQWSRHEAQPIADQIVFYDCAAVPAELPGFVRAPRSRGT
ncbi:hypothetical protein [Kaistia sp. MMO-174]|uniref:hypothetical protein n=1 Tax=Kaistia sp. MMO-174 TaxID=3081256 RepID=UPI0030176EA5